MALDPSIILQAGRGVTPLESPLDIQAKVTQLRGMQQAQEMAPAQMDLQRQKVQADADKFRMEMQEHVDKLNKEQREETRRRALDMGKAADWVKAGGLEAPMRWDKAAVSLGLPEYVGKYDPSQLDLLKIQAMTMTDLLKEKEEGNITGGVHADPGGNAWGTTKKGQAVPIVDPTTGRQMKVRSPGSGGSGGHGMSAPPANPNAEAGSVQERLQGVPSELRALVKQVGTYQMLSTQLSPRQKNQIMGYVAQVFPNYSVGDAEANLKFMRSLAASDPASAGGTIAASERLLGHVGELADLTDKLGNSFLGKVGNIVSGGIDRATGTGKAGDIKSFELVKGKVIAELNKLANGGVPHAEEMKEDIKQLTFSDPPDVKYKVLQAAAALGLEQTHAKEAQRDNLLGEFSPRTSFLSPRAQAVVKRVWKNAGAGDPNLAAPTTGGGYTTTAQVKEPYSQPAAPAKPKVGAVVDGYEFIGGDPAKPTSWKKQ